MLPDRPLKDFRGPLGRRALPLFALLAALAGCPQPGSGGTGGGSTAGGGEGGGAAGGGDTYAESSKANVRFKRAVRLANDFSAALGLDPADLCTELGQYPCATVVHNIALGGTEPYGVGLYEPLPFTGLTTPIVTDRVALAGCLKRTDADLAAGAGALVWKGVALDASGKLDVETQAMSDAVDTLYRRAVQRHATARELDHLKQLYRDTEATGKPQPGRAFMTLACFAVLTSAEALFY